MYFWVKWTQKTLFSLKTSVHRRLEFFFVLRFCKRMLTYLFFKKQVIQDQSDQPLVCSLTSDHSFSSVNESSCIIQIEVLYYVVRKTELHNLVSHQVLTSDTRDVQQCSDRNDHADPN